MDASEFRAKRRELNNSKPAVNWDAEWDAYVERDEPRQRVIMRCLDFLYEVIYSPLLNRCESYTSHQITC